MVRPFSYVTGEKATRRTVIYPEVCAWYGSLALAQLTGDHDLRARLVKKFDPLLAPENAEHLELYGQTGDERYLKLGLAFADQQWVNPTEDGITRDARYWIDDMYMITALQVQAYRATGEERYLDRTALAMVAYLDKLQQPNGLFFHTPDSPLYWSRGNGWMAVGMAELLRSLPVEHPQRARILEGYRKMMASLLKYQGKDGLWRQLIDQPDFWPETSGTGMFTFAMITGVKNGWLDAETYGPAARQGWLALVGYLDPDANLREVCAGTPKAFEKVGSDPGKQRDFYRDRPRVLGDLHGQAPVLWCASALLR